MKIRPSRSLLVQARVIVAVVVTTLSTAIAARAIPPGRAWTPTDTLKVNGHPYMVPDRFEPPYAGRIELIADGYHGPTISAGATHRTYGLVWADSVWRIRWSMDDQAYRTWPTLTPADRQMLVWRATNLPVNLYSFNLVTADVEGDSVGPRDTIAVVRGEALHYAGTSWGKRRWVSVKDFDVTPPGTYWLRLFRSDAPGSWQEMGRTGLTAWDGAKIAALDTSTVLVVEAGFRSDVGVHWGYLRDTTFTEMSPPLSLDPAALVPSLRPRPSGGFWCAWDIITDAPDYTQGIELRSFRDGVWAAPETLKTKKPIEAESFAFRGSELSAEGSEIPAVAWTAYGRQFDSADYIWTSFPTDEGFGVGERYEGSSEGANPTLVRDENGDVWLAWWRFFDGVYWSHTYATAVPSAPVIGERSRQPALSWTLDRRAPETWWAVLRGEGAGPLERVARLRAGKDTLMSWDDTTAPSGVSLRYAIRRECRDVRYQWTSAEARWEPRGPSLGVTFKSPNPATDRIEFEVVGANQGAIDVRLYDLQGREVVRQVVTAGGAGRDATNVTLDGRLQSGLYLLRVRSADGRLSPPAKIAIVR